MEYTIEELKIEYQELKGLDIDSLWGESYRNSIRDIKDLMKNFYEYGYNHGINVDKYIKSLISLYLEIEKNKLESEYLDY